jgi:hypothetical protein
MPWFLFVFSEMLNLLLFFQVYLNSDIAEVLTSDLPSSSTEQERSPPSSRRVSFGSEQIISSVGSQQDQLSSYRELLLCGKTHVRLTHVLRLLSVH